MTNLKYILTFTGIIMSFMEYSDARRGGDKFILGNQGPGCGPKFIFKSGSRKHKEWFILNECRDTHKHHDHHDHHYDHHHQHHEPHVLTFPIHLPPPQHHIHQSPPMVVQHHGYLPLPPAHIYSPHHGHHSGSSFGSPFPFDSPKTDKTSGLHKSPPSSGPGYPAAYVKYPRQALNEPYTYEAFKNEQQSSGAFSNDSEMDNDFDNDDNGLAAAPAEEGTVLPAPATLRQIGDWNSYQNSQLMAMRQRRNFRYGMPSSSSGPGSWRKFQSKRFANFHDKHF